MAPVCGMSDSGITRFTLAELCKATGAGLAGIVTQSAPARVWTDTRTLQAGDFFLPLGGANFDGHTYLAKAYEMGAVGAFAAESKLAEHPEWAELPNLLAVPDPLNAYLQVARFHRNRVDPIVVALTGSSGKTTTKEMLRAMFAPLLRTQATEKNFNNEVGVSQTLLALHEDTQMSVVEMGMRGLHQIDLLSEHVLPDVAIITNVGPAHIEMLGSLENVARAKLEIIAGMDREKGILVINGDDALLCEMAPKLWPGRLERYHLADAQDIQPTPEGGVRFKYHQSEIILPMPGRHMVSNALGVLKVGELLGYAVPELTDGLSAYQAGEGRWQMTPMDGFENAYVINDAYNANPDSLRASLQTLLEIPPGDLKRLLILGGMKELGKFSRPYHEQLGRWLAEIAPPGAIDRLFTVGDEGRWLAEAAQATGANFSVQAEPDSDSVIRALQGTSLNGTLVFLKGSRAYQLDKIPQELVNQTLHAANQR